MVREVINPHAEPSVVTGTATGLYDPQNRVPETIVTPAKDEKVGETPVMALD